jgi:hypothetical protein
MNDLLSDALAAVCETSRFDFKQQFDVASNRDWLEIVKDIVAIANSGGGIILFGLDNGGRPSGDDVSHLADIDPAEITDKIMKYTSHQFSALELTQLDKEGHVVIALSVSEALLPMVFEKPGTYPIDAKNQGRAFSAGTVYFRHGAKSEPGNTEDLRNALEREVDRRRQQWLENIRKVVEAPADSKVLIVAEGTEASGEMVKVRLVDDLDATPVEQLKPDETHPHRQKELIREVRKRLGKSLTFNSYDVRCLKVVHHVHEDQRFCYQPKFGSAQYSDALVDWIIDKCREDKAFLDMNRHACYGQRYQQKETHNGGDDALQLDLDMAPARSDRQ